jgi:hypothetical protein
LIIEQSSRLFYSANQKGGGFIVNIAQLKSIISPLPDDTILLLQTEQLDDVESVVVEFHSDNRTHIIFTGLE